MAHETMKYVLEALPDEERALWRTERRALVEEYTLYPDAYAGAGPAERKKIAPYALTVGGRDFHYLSVEQETQEGFGAWQTDITRKWRFLDRGFRHYLKALVRSLKAGSVRDAAGYMGWLCHLLQDQCCFIHSLEGPAGTHPFALNLFFPDPDTARNASFFLLERIPKISLEGYAPRLLGTSVEEAVFHLFHRFMEVKKTNRQMLGPMMHCCYARDRKGEDEIRGRIAVNVGKLQLDLFHTVFRLKQDRFPDREAHPLEKVDVTGLSALRYPNHLCPPYRFKPIMLSFSLNKERKPVPLRLSSDGRMVAFDKGFGTGCHREYTLAYAIPKGVFSRFEVRAGLHAELGQAGRVELAVLLDRKVLFRRRFAGGRTSARLNLDISRGGMLSLQARGLGAWTSCDNHIVWAEPVLIKRDCAPSAA